MDLGHCPSCSAPVSPKASACPKCGHTFRPPGGINLKDPVHLIGIVVAVLIALAALVGMWGAIG